MIELDEKAKIRYSMTVGQARRSANRINKESDLLDSQGCPMSVILGLASTIRALEEYADRRAIVEGQLLGAANGFDE